VARDNIDDLKRHMQSGKTLDPLSIDAKGREDGRHRAIAAKELGIKSVPVLRWASGEAPPIKGMGFGASTPKAALPDYGYDEIKIGKASVEVTRVDDSMTINRLKVPENARGQGEASRALDAVLQQADDQGVTTFLKADPVGTGGMTQPQLEAFYKSRGFVSDGADGMIRKPASRAERAAKFETPGSPEYEAAKAKGLNMSQAGRMARAKEMGFDTETVLYHGTTDKFSAFDPKAFGGKSSLSESGAKGVWLTSSENVADFYGELSAVSKSNRQFPDDRSQALTARGAMRADKQVMPLTVRGRLKEIDMGGAKYGADMSLSKMADDARAEGFDGVRFRNFVDGPEVSDHVLIFDPSNIRSVNAAFDPEKSGSSTLLAAAPFAAVGGAGLTLAGEDARNQRTVGKPKTSQSARTVGKAKTN
jgi:GNAT superfamily N-acetyltransferase